MDNFDRETQRALDIVRPDHPATTKPNWAPINWPEERHQAQHTADTLGKALVITAALAIGTGLGFLTYAVLRFVFGV